MPDEHIVELIHAVVQESTVEVRVTTVPLLLVDKYVPTVAHSRCCGAALGAGVEDGDLVVVGDEGDFVVVGDDGLSVGQV